MNTFRATYTSKDTATNVRGFVKGNMDEFHKILKAVLPYLILMVCASSYFQYLQLQELAPKFIEFQKELMEELRQNPENAAEIETKAFQEGFMKGMQEGLNGPLFYAGFLVQLFAGYCYAMIAINWHRVVLLGPKQYKPMEFLNPEKHELEFIAVLAVISIILPAIVSVTAFKQLLDMKSEAIIGIALVAIVFPYILYKISFYFPAKAVGSSIAFRDSFDLTRGYFWKFIWAFILSTIRVFGVLVLYSFIAGAIAGALKFVIIPDMSAEDRFIAEQMLQQSINIPIMLYFQPLLTVLGVTVLSNYYQQPCKTNRPPEHEICQNLWAF